MTVGQLIRTLQNFDPELEAVIPLNGDYTWSSIVDVFVEEEEILTLERRWRKKEVLKISDEMCSEEE